MNDTPPDEIVEAYVPALEAGIHITGANKKANSGEYKIYERIQRCTIQSPWRGQASSRGQLVKRANRFIILTSGDAFLLGVVAPVCLWRRNVAGLCACRGCMTSSQELCNRPNGPRYFYECNVGAGLPIIQIHTRITTRTALGVPYSLTLC
eukprot:gene10576-biopygen3508